MQSELNLIVNLKKIGGTSFVGVRNYENQQGEISNQTFNVGINIEKVLQHDLAALKNFTISQLLAVAEKCPDISLKVFQQGYTELVESLEKRLLPQAEKDALLAAGDSTMKRSKAQTEAYIPLAPGLKAHVDGENIWLHIYGFMVRKTVLKPGTYKEVNSQQKTIVKEAIKKAAGLKEKDYKQFKLGNATTVKINGLALDFNQLKPATV